MRVFAELLMMLATLAFGFLAAFNDNLVIQVYCTACFVILALMTIALVWHHAMDRA